MTKKTATIAKPLELDHLRERLREAEETLAAIRNGEVDSLIVTGPHGDQVFSLKGAEQPYRVFVEQMLEGAVTLTPDGTILYCNRRFAEMMRARLEKVIGSQVQAYVQSGDRDELAMILGAPAAAHKARFALAASDGSFVPAQLAFSRLPMDDEGVEAICVVVTDLTEQEEKRELTRALEQLRAAQEMLQQQNEELIRARGAAEAASEAKDAFLAALSHELRTPLTPVLMTVTSLEQQPSLDDAARDELTLLRRNVELEARLIDDLLDLTRIAHGKIELKPDVIDVHTLLHAAMEMSRSDLDAKKIRLEQELAATQVHVFGDAVRLQQILWNLIRNAVKFTPAGGHVRVSSANDAHRLTITIIDNGIGIESDAIDKIFTPFEQADRLITKQFGGLGLGLTISKRLAELHEGSLEAQSEGRNKGATFTLTLPLMANSQAAKSLKDRARSDHKAGAPGKAASAGKRELKILLVEDHDDTRISMKRLLSMKHNVRDTNNIATALRAAAEEHFDLVISDVGLPDGSGLDLMRTLHERHGIPGICLSGFGMEEDLANSAAAGFAKHLTKPIDLRQLESAIESLEI